MKKKVLKQIGSIFLIIIGCALAAFAIGINTKSNFRWWHKWYINNACSTSKTKAKFIHSTT